MADSPESAQQAARRRARAAAERDGLIWRQDVNSRAVRDTLAQRWRALSPSEQFAVWQQRGQGDAGQPVTLWEQYASATEAHERARLLRSGPTYDKLLHTPYVEVRRLPPEQQARAGGVYAYRAWHEQVVFDKFMRTATVPHNPGVARTVDEVLAVMQQVPTGSPWYRVFVYTEDEALRRDLQTRDIALGPRFSGQLAQERRQFYTLEAKQDVAQARERVDAVESTWATLSPAQQRRSWADAGKTAEPTVWEQRVAAHTHLARRQQMIPQASPDSDLPIAFVEVDRGATAATPYVVNRWLRVWDEDIGLTRYEGRGTVAVQALARVPMIAAIRQATIYADDLRIRTQLQQQGIAVAVEPHLAEQPPYAAREQERERGWGIGD